MLVVQIIHLRTHNCQKKIEYQVHDRVMHTATKQFLEDTAILNGIPKLIMKTNFSYY